MAFKSRDEGLGGIVPDLDCAVIRGGENVGFVGSGVVVDMIDTYRVLTKSSVQISKQRLTLRLVCLQCEIRAPSTA